MSHFRSIFRLISTDNSYQVDSYGPNNDPFFEFTPDDIAGLTLWVDPADQTVVATSADHIDAITNKGSVVCTVRPNVVTARPFLSQTLVNSRDVASFDGVDDVLSSSVGADDIFNVTAGQRAATYTVGVALKFNRVNAAGAYPYGLDVISAQGNSSWMFSIGTALGDTERVFIDQGSTTLTPWTRTESGQISSGSTASIIVTYATGTRDMYYNGAFVSGTDPALGPLIVADSLRIGGEIFPSQGSYFKGELCEFMIYTGSLKSSEITDLHTYLANRWGF